MSELYNGVINTFDPVGNLHGAALCVPRRLRSLDRKFSTHLNCYNYDFVRCVFVNTGQEVWGNTINQKLWKNMKKNIEFLLL